MGWQARLSGQAASAPLTASIPSVPPPRPGIIPSPSKWHPQVSGRLGAGSLSSSLLSEHITPLNFLGHLAAMVVVVSGKILLAGMSAS